MIYVIAVDFTAPQRNEARLDDWVRREFPNWAKPLSNLWIVEGALAAEQIRTALRPLLLPQDRLLITKAATEAVWQGLDDETARWLADNFPGSITERIPGATEGLIEG